MSRDEGSVVRVWVWDYGSYTRSPRRGIVHIALSRVRVAWHLQLRQREAKKSAHFSLFQTFYCCNTPDLLHKEWHIMDIQFLTCGSDLIAM